MPLIDIHLIKGSSTPEMKRAMMDDMNAVVGKVLGEPVKKLTWVRVVETEDDQWMIAGEIFTLEHVRKLRRGELK